MTEIRVLVVDDDPAFLASIKRGLHGHGYLISTTTKPTEALELLDRNGYDIMIIDEKMPLLSGSELLRIVSSRFPNLVSIMLTGHADLQCATKAINQGNVFRFLQKPCSMDLILDTVREALRHLDRLKTRENLHELIQMQSSYIENLERQHPGISKVTFDEEGAFVLEPIKQDPAQILKEICSEDKKKK
ncbi:MAG: response regulator [Oligoflexia bacterium]|nr:response regulator [Oligoflexia bacterium]